MSEQSVREQIAAERIQAYIAARDAQEQARKIELATIKERNEKNPIIYSPSYLRGGVQNVTFTL